MHPTQREILESLRQDNSKKFNQLLRDVAETSDNLTYHLKKLQSVGYINSPTKGKYVLAEKGTVYLNNNLELGHNLFPTFSCMLELVSNDNKLLIMKKLKQPFLGKVHLPTFGVISSMSLQAQINTFLERYKIGAENVHYKGIFRKTVQNSENLPILDKVFVVFKGNFTTFVPEIDDRQFLAVNLNELYQESNVLSGTLEVLSLNESMGFTEQIFNEKM
jgi:DNA-binding transcriptional ArsR family regulator